jgi:hypothetical protein
MAQLSVVAPGRPAAGAQRDKRTASGTAKYTRQCTVRLAGAVGRPERYAATSKLAQSVS